MSDQRLVECQTHGQVRPAYVCGHLRASLRDRVPRGVNYLRDEDGNVNGWCDACERRVMDAGDEWTDEVTAFAQITLICEGCFGGLKTFNTVNRLPD